MRQRIVSSSSKNSSCIYNTTANTNSTGVIESGHGKNSSAVQMLGIWDIE